MSWPLGRRTPLADRVWPKFDRWDPDWCWNWTAAKSSGYGHIALGGTEGSVTAAHRVVYELLVGTIPEGLELDHLCRNRSCVNPKHLEPVTPRVNQRRGYGFAGVNYRKTHCPQGHPYTPDNTKPDRGGRKCRACANARDRERHRRMKAALQ